MNKRDVKSIFGPGGRNLKGPCWRRGAKNYIGQINRGLKKGKLGM